MTTECTATSWTMEGPGRRKVEVDFSGGRISSDGGGLLLRQVDRRVRLTERMAGCFKDYRDQDLIEHTIEEISAQRVIGLALGYEDLSDHEALSRDPLMAAVIGKEDVRGQGRRRRRDRGQASASASTLGRVERTTADASNKSRYNKVVCDFDALRDLFVDIYIEHETRAPTVIVLDLDPSDIPLYGMQEQRFFHGHYGHHCYLPMYLFCGEYPLAVKLRPSNIDGALGAAEMLEPVIKRIRAKWPEVQIIIRGDSGFCREDLMRFCEGNRIDYVLGVARNARLEAKISTQMERARREHLQTQRPARRFREFEYRTLKTWSRSRRVVGKAEYLAKGANPRFVVTSLPAAQYEKAYLYEELYCARGEMENRIKELQLDLFGDRASCHTFRGNEVRGWFSLAAHVLIVALRERALSGTELAKAQASTLRVRLLKIGAQVTVSVRRVYVRLSSAFPLQDIFAQAVERLRSPPVPLPAAA